MSCFFIDPSNNSDLFDDEDESFYNDITFDPLVIKTSNKPHNSLNHNSVIISNNNLVNNSNQFPINQFPINQSAQNDTTFFNGISQNSMSNSNKMQINPPVEQNIDYESSSKNFIHGRIVSPAITAKSVNINRTAALPGAQKRPPHLRLNN